LTVNEVDVGLNAAKAMGQRIEERSSVLVIVVGMGLDECLGRGEVRGRCGGGGQARAEQEEQEGFGG